MRTEITYGELFRKYRDLEETYVIELLKIEIQEGKATEETTIFISEAENEILEDSEGNIYPYIKDKTYSLSDETNSFTIGYVYAND